MEFNREWVEEGHSDNVSTRAASVLATGHHPCVPNKQRWKSFPARSPSSKLSRHGPQTGFEVVAVGERQHGDG
jgi:hypothetical protein